MKKYKILIILVNLVLLLVYFNYSVAEKEHTLKSGQLILLELAPVDPRSLMQGDYMRLNYSISRNDTTENRPRRGYGVVRLNQHNVARLVRFQPQKSPLSAGEHLIAYTSPNKWSIQIGAESFFFQEGHAQKYEQGKYGGLMIDKQGRSVLVGLYSADFKRIE